MDTMIERVARAIAEIHWRSGPGFVGELNTYATAEEYSEGSWPMYRPQATAAIEAMREPTEAMENAAITYGDSPILLTYEAMIDAALGEPAKPHDPGIPIYATTEGPKETFQGKRKG